MPDPIFVRYTNVEGDWYCQSCNVPIMHQRLSAPMPTNLACETCGRTWRANGSRWHQNPPDEIPDWPRKETDPIEVQGLQWECPDCRVALERNGPIFRCVYCGKNWQRRLVGRRPPAWDLLGVPTSRIKLLMEDRDA